LAIRIQTRDNEPVEKALRRLRKLCNNEGVTRTSKAKKYFEKPSERRRREKRERKKAIRLSMRAKRQDTAKLLSRRRKARKNARAAQRAELANKPDVAETDSAPVSEKTEPVNSAAAAAAKVSSSAPDATPEPASAD
jgi:small subunit ribosomal protein S21